MDKAILGDIMKEKGLKRENFHFRFLSPTSKLEETKPEQNAIEADEDSLKDFCCRKAHAETIQLLEDISRSKKDKRESFERALKNLEENPSCELTKKYLMQMSKRNKYGENIPNPQNKKINPFVARAQEILEDLERCEGIRKGWFSSLKSDDRQILK